MGSRGAIHARQNLPDKEFRYLRTLRVRPPFTIIWDVILEAYLYILLDEEVIMKAIIHIFAKPHVESCRHSLLLKERKIGSQLEK